MKPAVADMEVAMKKMRIAIVGYGNIGKCTVDAVLAAEDMELAGIVRRTAKFSERNAEIPIVSDIRELDRADVALLCVPSRAVPETAKKYLGLGINTVDSYDIHASIADYRRDLDEAAKKAGKTAVISAGWDPGSDSIIRALLEAIAPKGITYTNFGTGMSMGHSVAAKAVEGVKDALSMTIPMGTGVHRRMVYVELEEGAIFDEVAARIKADDYFSHDETHVIETGDVSGLIDMGHGVSMTRKGVSGATHNQMFEFDMRINNPALTAQVMVVCARAGLRQQAGAYTMIELPVIDLLEGDKDDLIKRLV